MRMKRILGFVLVIMLVCASCGALAAAVPKEKTLESTMTSFSLPTDGARDGARRA